MMDYIKAFVIGGLICAAVQILLEKTKLMSGRVMVLLVCTGVVLGAFGIYQPFADFAGAGATVPLAGFGNLLWKGVKEAVDENGFVKVARDGGMDRRVLPGSRVVVYGQETLNGIVCCLPPHLTSGGEDKVPDITDMAVDVGLSKEEADRLIAPGDMVLLPGEPRRLMGTRVTGAALDDRAGCAALIRCAQLLQGEDLPCKVTVLLSTREEVGAQGAETAAFREEPDLAVAVDVSFAEQPGVPPHKCGKLSEGPMIGISPILDKPITDTLRRLAKEKDIPFQLIDQTVQTGSHRLRVQDDRALPITAHGLVGGADTLFRPRHLQLCQRDGICSGAGIHRIDQLFAGIKNSLTDGLRHLRRKCLDLYAHDTGIRVKGWGYCPAPVAQKFILCWFVRQTIPDVMCLISIMFPDMQPGIYLGDHVLGDNIVLQDIGVA